MKSWLCKIMHDVIINIFGCQCPPRQKAVIGFKFGLPTLKKRTPMPGEKRITNEQKINAVLNITTEGGKPAEVDGKPKWSVVSGAGGLVVSDDGKSADLISTDIPGETTYLVEADADLGAGVEPISDTIKIITEGAKAKNLGLTLGEPVNK